MDARDSPQIIDHLRESLNFTPFEVRWVPASAKFVLMGTNPKGTGALIVKEISGTELKTVTQTEKTDGIKCGTFGASMFERRHLATGTYNGNLNVWDLERLDTPTFSAKAHEALVNCIDGCGGLNIGGGAPELVTGGRDGCVKVWDTRVAEPVASLEPRAGQAVRDCWAVCFGNSFNDQERCVAAGYDNGDIKLLDLRANKLIWEANCKNGIVGLQFDRKDIQMNKLAVSSLEHRFRIYDMRTYSQTEGYANMTEVAHDKATVWGAHHLPQNRDIFMTAGGNGTLNLYKYNYPAQRSYTDKDTGETKGVMGTNQLLNSRRLAEQPIVSWDWHPEKLGLAVMCALDQQVKVAIVTKLSKY